MFKKFKTLVRLFLENIGLLKTRNDILKILPKNKVGAELGVFQGVFSKELITIAQPSKLHLIDPWYKLGEFYGEWTRKHNNGDLLSTRKAHQQSVDHVKSVDHQNVAVFHVDDDIACLKTFQDHYFDWVYLDSLHTYDHTKKELEVLDTKMKKDGLILGDDWKIDKSHPHFEMRRAINEFCEKYHWEICYLDKRNEQWAIKRK